MVIPAVMSHREPPSEITQADLVKLQLKSGQYFLRLSQALQSLPAGSGAGGAAKGRPIEVQGPTYAPQGVSGNAREGIAHGNGDSSAFGGWTRRELGRRFGVVFDFEIHRQPILTPDLKKKSSSPRKPKPAAHKPSNPPAHIYLNLLPISSSESKSIYLSLTPPPTPKRKQVKIQTDDGLLAGLWAGKVTPQAGYASGRLRVGGGREGGLEKVQELGRVLRDELERSKPKRQTAAAGQDGDQGAPKSDPDAVGAPSGQGGWGWGLNGGVRAKL